MLGLKVRQHVGSPRFAVVVRGEARSVPRQPCREFRNPSPESSQLWLWGRTA